MLKIGVFSKHGIPIMIIQTAKKCWGIITTI